MDLMCCMHGIEIKIQYDIFKLIHGNEVHGTGFVYNQRLLLLIKWCEKKP